VVWGSLQNPKQVDRTGGKPSISPVTSAGVIQPPCLRNHEGWESRGECLTEHDEDRSVGGPFSGKL